MNSTFRTTRNCRNTVALGTAATVAFLMVGSSGCSSKSSNNVRNAAPTSNASAAPPGLTSTSKTAGESVPASLANAGEYGENIYDYAKANDWKNAGVKLAALKDAVKSVRTEAKSQTAAVDRLDANVATLDRAVAAKDRPATMREANQVTLAVADMSTSYKLGVPVEVTKLDYYGRELEIWAEAQDANKLQATAREMRQTWDRLRPSIETHSEPETKKFDALVAQVESAKTPADYARVATPVLDEVDNLEKLFH